MLPASPTLDAPADAVADPEWAAEARQTLQQADARLYRRFDQNDNIERLLALRAHARGTCQQAEPVHQTCCNVLRR